MMIEFFIVVLLTECVDILCENDHRPTRQSISETCKVIPWFKTSYILQRLHMNHVPKNEVMRSNIRVASAVLRRPFRVCPEELGPFRYVPLCRSYTYQEKKYLTNIYALSCMDRLGNKSVDYRYLICNCQLTIYSWKLILSVVASVTLQRTTVNVPNIFILKFSKMKNHEITRLYLRKDKQ